MSALLSAVKKVVPSFVWRYFKDRGRRLAYSRLQHDLPAYRERMLKRLEAVRSKERITVAFQVFSISMWKCASVLKLMQEHPRFTPFIWVAPHWEIQDPAARKQAQLHIQEYFSAAGVETFLADSEEDLLAGRKPDIVFPAQPYESVSEALHKDMEQALYCYVHYGMHNTAEPATYDNVKQNKFLFNFLENKHIADVAKSIMTNGGSNVEVTGHPALDAFFSGEELSGVVWKDCPGCKRVIWAPHWVLLQTRSFMGKSSFLELAEGMLDLASKYRGRLQFAFKPHPNLRTELYRHPAWGKERTDAFYASWQKGVNTQLADGAYADLFCGSDAMVHDSGSFVIEYLACGKPCLFVRNEDDMPPFEHISLAGINAHYRAADLAGVEDFLRDVVLGGEDQLESRRYNFRLEYLVPPNGCTAARNIVDTILGGSRTAG